VTAAFGLALVALVAAITAVDVDRRVIPDPLNVALAALGLAWQALRHQAPPLQAALAAAAVFLFLWAIAAGFRRVRGVVGLGLGDVKMAAAAATWISPWNLPLLLFAACCTALVAVGIAALAGRRADRGTRIPFGPFIGLGLMLVWGLEVAGLPTLVPGE
jgi:prepilin signal peptidase PulO-like enzyme (type II secretory pathway)